MPIQAESSGHDEPQRRGTMTAEQRRELLARAAAALAAAPGVRLAFAFGSFARGEPFRDIDIGVWLDDPSSRRALGQAEDALGAALGEAAARLDVIPLNDAAPGFLCEAVDGGQLLFERVPGDGLALAVRARSQAIDYADWRRSHEAAGH